MDLPHGLYQNGGEKIGWLLNPHAEESLQHQRLNKDNGRATTLREEIFAGRKFSEFCEFWPNSRK